VGKDGSESTLLHSSSLLASNTNHRVCILQLHGAGTLQTEAAWTLVPQLLWKELALLQQALSRLSFGINFCFPSGLDLSSGAHVAMITACLVVAPLSFPKPCAWLAVAGAVQRGSSRLLRLARRQCLHTAGPDWRRPVQVNRHDCFVALTQSHDPLCFRARSSPLGHRWQ